MSDGTAGSLDICSNTILSVSERAFFGVCLTFKLGKHISFLNLCETHPGNRMSKSNKRFFLTNKSHENVCSAYPCVSLGVSCVSADS